VTFSASAEAQPGRAGLRILPDLVAGDWPVERLIPAVRDRPAKALDHALAAIGDRYGRRTAELVAMQLEYTMPQSPR
jgi:hypothetical protein